MTSSRRGVAVIDMLSGLLLVGAAALYWWPVRASVAASNPTALSTAVLRADSSFSQTDDVGAIVAANIMSGTRRAPSKRYVSPDRAGPSEYEMPPAFAPARDSVTSGNADDAESVPSLFGIVNVDGVSRALLRLSEREANPVLLREGDSRGSYRVISIRSNFVIIAGPSGQRTLRLARPALGDSTGKPL